MQRIPRIGLNFEDLESHLINEVRSSFPKSVEKDRITTEIDIAVALGTDNVEGVCFDIR
jgi:hypothetical protein